MSFLVISCSEKEEGVLSEEKMVDVLKEIHLSDALLNDKRIFDRSIPDSALSYYSFVWVKHQVSFADFKKSLAYYTENPLVFENIYDSVLSELIYMRDSIRENDQVELVKAGYKMNLWSQKVEWSVPKDGAINTIRYKITTNNHGVYTLSANVRMFENDSSVNQKMTIVAYYEDETFDANSDYSLKKDGEWHKLVAKIRTNENKKLNRIAGWVLDHSKLNGSKHADVRELKLIYSSK